MYEPAFTPSSRHSVISATGMGNVITQPTVPTDLAGQATATLATTVGELKTVTATIDPGGAAIVLDDLPTVDFIPNLSASLSSAVPVKVDLVFEGS